MAGAAQVGCRAILRLSTLARCIYLALGIVMIVWGVATVKTAQASTKSGRIVYGGQATLVGFTYGAMGAVMQAGAIWPRTRK